MYCRYSLETQERQFFSEKVTVTEIGGKSRIRPFPKKWRREGDIVYIRIKNPDISSQDVVRKLFGIINDKTYTGGYQGDIVFTPEQETAGKIHFLKIKDLKKK